MDKSKEVQMTETEHIKYMKEIEEWWRGLSEEDKMDMYDYEKELNG